MPKWRLPGLQAASEMGPQQSLFPPFLQGSVSATSLGLTTPKVNSPKLGGPTDFSSSALAVLELLEQLCAAG